MNCSLRCLTFVASVLVGLLLASGVKAENKKWVSLFDGKTTDGWEKVGKEKSVWEVKDGALCGSGPASMLVCTKGPYKNFRYRAEVKINDGGNSGLYFRTTRKPSFADGYEAQIDSTHRDPIRTGVGGNEELHHRAWDRRLPGRSGGWRGRSGELIPAGFRGCLPGRVSRVNTHLKSHFLNAFPLNQTANRETLTSLTH